MQNSSKSIIKWYALPSEYYGRAVSHSGLPVKHFTDIGVCVVDEDYRGNVAVVLFNFGKETFDVKRVIELHSSFLNRFLIQKQEVYVLDDAERGSRVFGSTGSSQSYSKPTSLDLWVVDLHQNSKQLYQSVWL